MRIRVGSRPRDTQRKRVYTWEDEDLGAFDARLLTLEEGRTLCTTAWRMYRRGWPAPTFRNGRVNGCGLCYRVTVPDALRTPHVVLHETAHAILDSYPHQTAWHGPEFVRLLIDLLVQFKTDQHHIRGRRLLHNKHPLWGKRALAQTARERQIKIASRVRLKEVSQK